MAILVDLMALFVSFWYIFCVRFPLFCATDKKKRVQSFLRAVERRVPDPTARYSAKNLLAICASVVDATLSHDNFERNTDLVLRNLSI